MGDFRHSDYEAAPYAQADKEMHERFRAHLDEMSKQSLALDLLTDELRILSAEERKKDKQIEKQQKKISELESLPAAQASEKSAPKKSLFKRAASKASKPAAAAPAEKPGISILVMTYDDAMALQKTINSLDAARKGLDIEVISEDASASLPKAQAAALAKAEKAYVLFLNEGDAISDGYLEAMMETAGSDMDLVLGFLGTDGAAGVEKCPASKSDGFEGWHNYYLTHIREKTTSHWFVFTTLSGKLVRKSLLDACAVDGALECAPALWARAYSKMQKKVRSCSSECAQAYAPNPKRFELGLALGGYKAQVDPLSAFDAIAATEKVAFDACASVGSKKFATNVIYEIEKQLKSRYDAAPEEERAAIRERAFAYDGLFMNTSFFSEHPAICFSYCFSPSVFPPAYVATKRLGEIDSLEGINYNWKVVSKDMSDRMSTDDVFESFYSRFAFTERIELGGWSSIDRRRQLYYGIAAYNAARDDDAEVIYSRSDRPGSHIAAYLYKKDHPQAKWYAEFSDPLNMANCGIVRDRFESLREADCELLANFYEECELVVYECADVIVFTNENQRDFMLDYNRVKELEPRVREHAAIMHQPAMDGRFSRFVLSDYELDESKINIAYFGKFYETRTCDGMLKLVSNPDVVLHLFVSADSQMGNIAGEQVKVGPYRPYFEFLNLASRMDYLYLNDMQAIYGCIPWLPSKYTDYVSADGAIIAECKPGSPLSQMEYDRLIKVDEIDESLALSLKKTK